MNEMELSNYAYTEEYKSSRRKYEIVFCPECFISENKILLSEKYSLIKKHYQGKLEYNINATENKLIGNDGSVLYEYRNIDNDAEFCTIITHSNGKEYMIFRCDLYGHSVLNLSTLEDFHYFPRHSFNGGETFIWTEIFYNPPNNILVVGGCYWACPFGLFLYDFSNPMQTPTTFVDIRGKLDSGYEKYDDIDFLRWEDTDLILECYNNEQARIENIVIKETEYLAWF